MRSIWVYGYIHNGGGAGTELLHQIELWLAHGIEVHLCVPPGSDVLTSRDDPRRAWCDSRGIHTDEITDGMFRDRIVVSFCEREFLRRLPDIARSGKPRLVIWFNCMTWCIFPEEVDAHRAGLIDVHGYQSKYQHERVAEHLLRETCRQVTELRGYVPYYHLTHTYYGPRRSRRACTDRLVIGRISRDDPTKFPSNFWHFLSRISAPVPLEFFVVGYGPSARSKCGDPESDTFAKLVNRTWWGHTPNAGLLVDGFWPRVHVLLHKWDTFKENYPRAVLEAMASGVPVIADADGGTREIITQGQTGFLVGSQDEAVYRASQLAWSPDRRKIIADSAYDWLIANVANADKAWCCWEDVFNGRYVRT